MFKIGDRVRVVENPGNEEYFHVGDTGEVIEVGWSDYVVRFDVARLGNGEWFVDPFMVEAE